MWDVVAPFPLFGCLLFPLLIGFGYVVFSEEELPLYGPPFEFHALSVSNSFQFLSLPPVHL